MGSGTSSWDRSRHFAAASRVVPGLLFSSRIKSGRAVAPGEQGRKWLSSVANPAAAVPLSIW